MFSYLLHQNAMVIHIRDLLRRALLQIFFTELERFSQGLPGRLKDVRLDESSIDRNFSNRCRIKVVRNFLDHTILLINNVCKLL